MRKSLVLGTLTLAVAGSALASVPASAADTTVTFTAGTTGGVSILPAAAAAGTTSGSTVTATILSTITDLRTGPTNWTSTVSSTGFTLVGASAPVPTAASVPAASVSVVNGAATVAVPGTATVTNAHVAGNPLTLSTGAQTLMTATTTNVNTVTYTSTVSIDVSNKTAGAYTGTITQSVS